MTTDNTRTEGQTEAVQPVVPREIDWTAIEPKWQEQREADAAKRKLERVGLLEALRGKEITSIEARYDGYGDSGNVGEIALNPKTADLGDIETRLSDFIWGMAYNLHPGFENNDGWRGRHIQLGCNSRSYRH